MKLTDIFLLFGGLGFFLYGMELMGTSIRSAAGSRLKAILEKLTTNRLIGVLVGTLVTMVIQSSAATIVMVVSFVNAGLMTLPQAFGVILGANIGTTITAQIIAFKSLSEFAPLFVIIGVVPLLFARRNTVKHIGGIIAGFGILFVGINLMGEAMEPLRDSQLFIDLMTSFTNPILGILLGIFVTAIIQSSSASIGIVQTLAGSGVLSVYAGIYITLGCNIGTCVTALLSSINSNTMGKRAAFMHLSCKILGVVIVSPLLLLTPAADLIINLTPDNPMQQIANFHTIFNIIITFLLLPFAKQMTDLVSKMFKNSHEQDDSMMLVYINERTLKTPQAAIINVRREIFRLSDIIKANYERAVEAFFGGDETLSSETYKHEDAINYLSTEITRFLVKLQSSNAISAAEKHEAFNMYNIIIDLERIGDHSENIAQFGDERREKHAGFSQSAIMELHELVDKVRLTLEEAIKVLKSKYTDEDARNKCAIYEDEVDKLYKQMRINHLERLNSGTCDPLGGTIFTDIIIDLERIADHAVNVAGINDESENRGSN